MSFFEKFTGGEKKKNKESDLGELPLQAIRNLVEAANTISNPQHLLEDGELQGQISKKEKEILEAALKKLAEDCWKYQELVRETRALIRLAVLAGGSVASSMALLPLAYSQRIDLVAMIPFIPMMFGLGSTFRLGMGGKDGDIKSTRFARLIDGFGEAKQLNQSIKKTLLALRIPKSYIEEKFTPIVTAFAMAEQQDRELQELIQARQELGLDTSMENDQETLENLLAGISTDEQEVEHDRGFSMSEESSESNQFQEADEDSPLQPPSLQSKQ